MGAREGSESELLGEESSKGTTLLQWNFLKFQICYHGAGVGGMVVFPLATGDRAGERPYRGVLPRSAVSGLVIVDREGVGLKG